MAMHFKLTATFSFGERGDMGIRNTLTEMYDYTPKLTSALRPLTLDVYATFVLIPHIATLLIREDLSTDMDGGWEAMQLGVERGKKENTMQDPNPILNAVFAVNEKCCNIFNRNSLKTKNNKKKGKENVVPLVCSLLFVAIWGFIQVWHGIRSRL
jgi:RTC4-like domain